MIVFVGKNGTFIAPYPIQYCKS